MTSDRAARRCRAAILVSGSGTNLQAFIDQSRTDQLDVDIVMVLSNQPEAKALARARDACIPTACIMHRDFADREKFDRAVVETLDKREPDLIVLAGFMRILSPWFVRHYEGRILNIHPALLPKYRGLDTHTRVLEGGDSRHGCTAHFVTEELDGGPRILAGRIVIDRDESPEELQARVLAVEHQIYPKTAQWFAENRLRFHDGAAILDGKELTEPVMIDFD